MQDWYDFVFAIVSRYRDDTARTAIHAANPDAVVLSPEVSPHALTDGWFRAAMQTFGDAFDIVTVHWYPGSPPLGYTMDELVKPYARFKSVWLTEVGAKPCTTLFGEAGQALLYQQVLNAFLPRRDWWMTTIFFDVYQPPVPNDCGNAIVRPDWTNRPAFSLLQATIKTLPD